MDLDMIAANLETIEDQLQELEEEKRDYEHALGRLLQHPPALYPELVGQQMQELRNHIRIRRLEQRISGLLRAKEALIVSGASRVALAFNRDPPGN